MTNNKTANRTPLPCKSLQFCKCYCLARSPNKQNNIIITNRPHDVTDISTLVSTLNISFMTSVAINTACFMIVSVTLGVTTGPLSFMHLLLLALTAADKQMRHDDGVM